MQKHPFGEEEALATLIGGREEGLDYFFRRYYAPLTFFAQGLVGNQETAEDLVEDAFLKLWERREELGSQGSLRSWLYTTVKNACIDLIRREKRKLNYIKVAQATSDKEDKPVLHHIIQAETMHQVYNALQSLPPKCGQVFRMYYLEEKSLQEIAVELNLSLSTVKSQKGRAIELLRKKLPHLNSFFVLLSF
jgi:RNA polymerase sigma-70 factor (ECF subfamily)